jgi:hypothetical protein
MDQLDPHLDQLVLAARQLEFSKPEVVDALRSKWEKTDD